MGSISTNFGRSQQIRVDSAPLWNDANRFWAIPANLWRDRSFFGDLGEFWASSNFCAKSTKFDQVLATHRTKMFIGQSLRCRVPAKSLTRHKFSRSRPEARKCKSVPAESIPPTSTRISVPFAGQQPPQTDTTPGTDSRRTGLFAVVVCSALLSKAPCRRFVLHHTGASAALPARRVSHSRSRCHAIDVHSYSGCASYSVWRCAGGPEASTAAMVSARMPQETRDSTDRGVRPFDLLMVILRRERGRDDSSAAKALGVSFTLGICPEPAVFSCGSRPKKYSCVV